jgi:hypothetical protein
MFKMMSDTRTELLGRSLFLLVVLLVLVPDGEADAHHGAAAHFDPDDVVTLEGMITELQFVNPDAWVHIDAVDDGGVAQSWRCELSGATQLIRRGGAHSGARWCLYRDLRSPGQTVKIVGERARREENACAMRTIVLTDGKLIESGLGIEGAVIPATVVSAAGAAPRPKYLDNGQPNLSGAWVSPSGGGTGNVNNGPPEPSAAGLAASEEFNFRDVLIVDTVGLLPRALIPRAEVMISGQTHILERFEYDEAERVLIRHYTVTDPLYLEKPYSGVNVSDIAAQQYRRSIVWI